jgi:nitric oxide reductase NorD protein
VYRVLTARASGFIEFGSLNLDLESVEGDWPAPREGEMVLERMLRGFANPSIARSLFVIFEHARVERRLRLVYPGVARRMDALGPSWRNRTTGSPSKTMVDQVLSLVLARVTGGDELAVDDVCRGVATSVLSHVKPENWTRVEDTVAAVVLAYPSIDALLERAQDTARIGLDVVGFDPEALSQSDRDVEVRAESLLKSLKEVRPEDWKGARDKAKSEGQSYEEMSDFLDALEAPDGPLRNPEEDAEEAVRSGRFSDDPDVDPDVGVGVFQYPEWDHHLMDYKPNWVRLTEYALRSGHTDFVDAVIAEHGPMIDSLRKSFEALRPESMQRFRGLADGDELDFDAVVDAHILRRAGRGGEEGLYIKRVRANRDVAVAFLVDMSSSTNEHINTASKRIIDVEREALVLTAEAVHALGDDAAIFGYSGFGRDQVAFYVAKEFSDPWDSRVRERIGRIGWKMENRDGAAIRHAITKMADHPAKVKLLILLSDGKPLDCGCDHYSDQYAQEDTRMALIEARNQGVHPFCITVDPHGRSYLRRMYGEGSYTIIDSVEALPQRLPTIYRRLTR